jgi:hypothetical protein
MFMDGRRDLVVLVAEVEGMTIMGLLTVVLAKEPGGRPIVGQKP